MSIKTILLLLGLAGIVGIGVGYLLRWLVALGQKGSVDIQIKQKLLEAKEQAKKIVEEAEKKGAEREAALKEELRLKEEGTVEKEKRLGQKEGFLDQRQFDLDKEAECIKAQIDEVKKLQHQIMHEIQKLSLRATSIEKELSELVSD